MSFGSSAKQSDVRVIFHATFCHYSGVHYYFPNCKQAVGSCLPWAVCVFAAFRTPVVLLPSLAYAVQSFNKKIPKNPRYDHIKSQIDTGERKEEREVREQQDRLFAVGCQFGPLLSLVWEWKVEGSVVHGDVGLCVCVSEGH